MKICIFGADGRTGVEVVKECVKQGYQVIAFVYNDTAKAYLPEGIEIVKGDILNKEEVLNAMRGANAVISVVGHIKNSDPLMQTKGMTNIVEGMKNLDIERIISLTGTGVRIEGDTPSFFDRIGNAIIKIVDRKRIIDGINHAEVLKSSGLDWTILRVLKLTQIGSSNISYTLTPHGPAEAVTSRKKVAKIMVDIVISNQYVGEMPVSS